MRLADARAALPLARLNFCVHFPGCRCSLFCASILLSGLISFPLYTTMHDGTLLLLLDSSFSFFLSYSVVYRDVLSNFFFDSFLAFALQLPMHHLLG